MTSISPSPRYIRLVIATSSPPRSVPATQPLQFNVLVTTYEFAMNDRSRLCRVDWKYIIIDEAQRMKDRESKLAKDLDRFKASRRLLLTGEGGAEGGSCGQLRWRREAF